MVLATLPLRHARLDDQRFVHIGRIDLLQLAHGEVELVPVIAGGFQDCQRAVPRICALLPTLNTLNSGVAVGVDRPPVGTSLKQLNGLEVEVVLDAHVQRRLALEVLGVNIGLLLQELLHQVAVPILGGDVQATVPILWVLRDQGVEDRHVHALDHLLDLSPRLVPTQGGVDLRNLRLIQRLRLDLRHGRDGLRRRRGRRLHGRQAAGADHLVGLNRVRQLGIGPACRALGAGGARIAPAAGGPRRVRRDGGAKGTRAHLPMPPPLRVSTA
mmetsp:Transcript_69071/g.200424  ORF Transcript_69071/g.200424 Transcript_69071/m.200424 type:complete len:271 (+) Transcript_69071:233-1045(+)